MRVYRTNYKDRQGQTRQAAKWYIEMRDHLSIVRRFAGFTDKRMTEALGRQIERLVAGRIAGEQPDREQSVWLEQIPAKLRERLASIGLLSAERGAAGKPLTAHLADFKAHLLAKGNTAAYAKKTTVRVRKIFEGCKFTTWTEISGNKVQRYLADLREGERGINAQTFNYYLQAIKQFCRWMVDDRRASESPLAYLKAINANADRRHERRALELDELRRLLETTRTGPERFNMTGAERAMLYQLAVESGLRASELLSLTVASFDWDACTVSVQAAYSKHRRQDVLPLRPDHRRGAQGGSQRQDGPSKGFWDANIVSHRENDTGRPCRCWHRIPR